MRCRLHGVVGPGALCAWQPAAASSKVGVVPLLQRDVLSQAAKPDACACNVIQPKKGPLQARGTPGTGAEYTV